MSEETRKLTEGYFEFEPLGTARVKGVSEAVELYRLVGLGQLHTKLDVSAKRGLAKFVGRKAEIAVLGQSFELAKKGRGQIIGVVGEPGVGKSRLGHEFKVRCQKGVRVLVVFAVSHGKSSPYLPVIELLRSYFEIGLGDDEIRQREKITGKVLTLDRSLEDTLPYLFMLLGIPEEKSPLAQMDPQIRRQRTLEALKRLVSHTTFRNTPSSGQRLAGQGVQRLATIWQDVARSPVSPKNRVSMVTRGNEIKSSRSGR